MVNISMEKNDKGYDIKGILIYELKNGKGYVKEYEYDKLSFEGEYLNGERNCNGKEYDNNGELKFEREYLNGERNCKGKEYWKYGKLKFELNIWMDKEKKEKNMVEEVK